ncbi:MAG: MarR family transcriptional regulator [Candidatus Acidiferrum sp.]
MAEKITEQEYRALGELRYLIRRFVQEGDVKAKQAGLEPQQYLLLLAIRGLPPEEAVTISTLANRLSLRHHSTVELIDRMESHGYVKRIRGREDRREVLVSLQPRGARLLEKVVAQRIIELRAHGRALVAAISSLLEPRARILTTKSGRRGRTAAQTR